MATEPALVDACSDLVMYASRLTRAIRRRHEMSAGLRVLALLDQHGPLGITQLAHLDRCSQPTMSAAVGGLVERGWLAKEPHPTDRRGSVVALTDEGSAELRRARRANGEAIAARVRERTDHTTDEVLTAVAVLRDLLETDDDEGTP
ncbi:MarR family winged helix-turn-helix transcriptional regulator [Nocardioides caldifontis]|uniref:MarR family winged helix-turn-helix transcriptional regulator n=1 Tax=Nocardioides caldifontis TaxID=2588938 RepID=UPI001EF0467E|nr:MarR family transcriptional regulator [Nocardioides caldifontis]